MTPMTPAVSPDQDASPPWDTATLARLRKELLRFAILQLRNSELAEDAVQEALAAAVATRERFEGRASVKTWVFAILKNKIIDILRDRWNKDRQELNADTDDSDFDVLFKTNDRWQRSEIPSAWGNPEQAFENLEFWQIFDICMNNMPEATGRVFAMREFLGLEVPEICKELGISSSNCWVILHRARMSLRLCLQQRWFESEDAK